MNKEEAIKFLKQLYPNGGHCWLDEQRMEAIGMAIKALQEEPVSEELEKAAEHYLYSNILYDDVYVGNPTDKDCIEMFKAGAKWQEDQLEKNRLEACDRQTEEEAEIESNFCIGIIENEHRQPTFNDAIKYGMRLQKKQMMARAFPAEIDSSRSDGRCILAGNFARFETGERVKVIAIKED